MTNAKDVYTMQIVSLFYLYCIYGYLDSYGGGCTKYDRETNCKNFERFKLDIDKFNYEFGINPDKV